MPWLVLAKTSMVTYKIQRCTGAEPEILHVDKLMPYQADFGEELRSWLQDEESGGHSVLVIQTSTPVPSETSPELATGSSASVEDSPHDPGPESCDGTDVEDESLTVSGPRCSQQATSGA